MSNPIDSVQDGTSITVIGVGGAGGNAVRHMIQKGFSAVKFITANTDAQALSKTCAETMLKLGDTGLGAGANPEVGRETAKEAKKKIAEALHGSHMVFVTAGMGGGTGTGAAPVIAEVAREMGILTVGVVTKPFEFEGRRRSKQAAQGVEELTRSVDSLIVVFNDRLLETLGEDVTQSDAFAAADDVLYSAVAGISEIINCQGIINVDFEDVRSVMGERGRAMMGYGIADGEERSRAAAEQAIACPLLEGVNLASAKGVLVNITASQETLRLKETRQVMDIIREYVDQDANIICGAVYDDSMGDKMRVTVVATGLADVSAAAKPPATAPRLAAVPTLTDEIRPAVMTTREERKAPPVPRTDPYAGMERPAVFRSGRALPAQIAAEDAHPSRAAPVATGTPVVSVEMNEPSPAASENQAPVTKLPAALVRPGPSGVNFEDCIPAFLRKKAAA